MPRATGKIGRGTLQYTYLWKVAQGLTTRPVKFGTIVPDILGTSLGNDFYAKQEELLFALADAMHEELDDLADAGCRDHPDGGAEHPSRRHPARRRADAASGVLRRHVQQDREGPSRQDRSLVPHVLGESRAAAAVRDEPVVRERAAAAEQTRRRRHDVRDLRQRRTGSRSHRQDDHWQEDRHRRRRSPESAGRDARAGRGDDPEGADSSFPANGSSSRATAASAAKACRGGSRSTRWSRSCAAPTSFAKSSDCQRRCVLLQTRATLLSLKNLHHGGTEDTE